MLTIELKDGDLACVKAGPNMEVTKGEAGRLIAIVSTETEDHDRDIIHQGKNKKGGGWLLDRFNTAPVLLWQHRIDMMNLSGPETRAKVANVEGRGRVLTLNPLTFDEGDEYAMHLAGKVERRSIVETSVGFIGKLFEWRKDGEQVIGREFFEQELVEVSFANRGANPETDTIMAKMMLLGAPGATIAAKAEDAGDPEVQELKDEIADLKLQVATVQTLVKSLGDVERKPAPVALSDAEQARDQYNKAMRAAAAELYSRLTALGIAHK